MARTQTMVQLDDELIGLLDREAADRGTSRSALIRSTLREALASSRRAALDEAQVEGYTRMPQADPDEWGSLPEQSDRSTLETLKRLETEESKPW